MKAIEVLFVFLTAWVEKDFNKAHDKTSKTWAKENKPEYLKKILPEGIESFKIKGFTVLKSPVNEAITANLVLKGEIKTVIIKLVCESWPDKKDPYGDWGVIPESIQVNTHEAAETVEPEEKPKATTKPVIQPTPKKATHAGTKKR